ncbi:MAG: hypothetical protein DYH12_30645 [Sorangiineae bacterium PRO1]|nr:hypothetical protein [Sorangiineae bacterium PRO1]
MTRFVPHALALLALAVALSDITPASAVKTMRRALFATNSGAVDGISASRTPKPGQLLALDAEGRFPGSVLAGAGTAGARGPRGAEGPVGPRGPSSLAMDSRAGSQGELSSQMNVPKTLAELRGLQAGSYLLQGSAWFSALYHAGSQVSCGIFVNGEGVAGSATTVGTAAGFSQIAAIGTQAAVDRPAAFDVSLRCVVGASITPGQVPVAWDPKLAALRVESLQTP